MKKGYRELIVEGVERYDEQTHVHLKGCVVSLAMNHVHLKKHNISPEDIVTGTILHVKGRSGNDDMDLARRDAVEDMIIT